MRSKLESTLIDAIMCIELSDHAREDRARALYLASKLHEDLIDLLFSLKTGISPGESGSMSRKEGSALVQTAGSPTSQATRA